MTNDRIQDAIVYISGVLVLFISLGFIYKFYNEPKPPSTIQVVETWDGCDIIKYQDQLFLKCK